MKRKDFIKQTVVVSASFFITKDLLAKPKGPVYGHGSMRYSMDDKWGQLNPEVNPVNDCHEMVQDSKGRIILLTNETRNNVLIYNKSGKLLESWGHEFPGAHGLTLTKEGKTDYLFITDTNKHQVFKTSLDGKILMTINCPMETGLYKKIEEFVPTEVAVADNGDFFIADGYGAQYVLHYNAEGKLLSYFGGRGTETKEGARAMRKRREGVERVRRARREETMLKWRGGVRNATAQQNERMKRMMKVRQRER